jgi:hypothetical protein
MALKGQRYTLAVLLCFGAMGVFACEDNPDECYDDGDCPDGLRCATSKFLTGSPSGGHCVQCLTDDDCTDPALPTCEAVTNTCKCDDPEGCGPQEGGVEAGVEGGTEDASTAEPDGATEEGDAGGDDAGS